MPRIRSLVVSVLILITASAAVGAQFKWRSDIWTEWHRAIVNKAGLAYSIGVVKGLLGLAQIRAKLNEENLQDTYTRPRPDEVCPLEEGCYKVSCGPESRLARSADGSCTHPTAPVMGSVGSRFSRNVKDTSSLPARFARELDDGEIMKPNPLEVSRRLLSRDLRLDQKSEYDRAPVNVLAAAWIQFQNHDWFSHGDNVNNYEVAKPFVFTDVDAGGNLMNMVLPRTTRDDTRAQDDAGFPTFRNEVTHWWDGSQIYGSTREAQDCAPYRKDKTRPEALLRECEGGRMLVTADQLLPREKGKDGAEGKEKTGFNRNWWAGLGVLHTAFVRNHNLIAGRLATAYPELSDDQLFAKARLVNAAIMAKIHTVEWTPGILANPILRIAMNANWYGVATGTSKLVREKYLDAKTATKVTNIFEKGACNPVTKLVGFARKACPLLEGLVGGDLQLHDRDFALTEEFTSVYRLHSLLPETLQLRGASGEAKSEKMQDVREEKEPAILARYGVENVARSLGKQAAASLTIGNFPAFMRNINVPITLKGVKLGPELQFDLAAVDLVRDRERGVPRYNEFRRQLNLQPIQKFTDLMPQDVATVKELNRGISQKQAEDIVARNRKLTAEMAAVYGDVEKIDLLVGTLAEAYRPEGYGFGETMFQVFVLMASRRLQADYFYTTGYTDEVYTAEGRRMVDEATMKKVLVDAYGLADSEVPDNAFAIWN
jgi:hypothetical protein